MTDEDLTWDDYYQKIQGRAPRPLLMEVLNLFDRDAPQNSRDAIDLGCGDGTETIALLGRGWKVLAIDGEPASIKRLLEKLPGNGHPHLQTRIAKFEELVLPLADLIHASFSLPFCQPAYFDAFWEKIVNAVKPGGRFAGQLFGVNDSWANETDMTFHTSEQVREMMRKFEVESFVELEEDGQAASGPKHWHLFTVIVKKIRE